MNKSKVSIILLCHNHAAFVQECIQSVYNQTYSNCELIIVDDCSNDESRDIIEGAIRGKNAVFIPLQKNQGICKAFNIGLQEANGEFVIDLSADDILYPEKLEMQVAFFESLDKSFGVIYSDAQLVNEDNVALGTHVKRVKEIGKVEEMPSGAIFPQLLRSYFIAAPTQMIRKQVLDELGGYDESLTYEDFDFWIRSSRKWKYAYQDNILMTIRKLTTSMSAVMYTPDDPKVGSTLKVCKKAQSLIQNREEEKALVERVRYEFRMAVKYRNQSMKSAWYGLLKELGGNSLFYFLLRIVP